MIVFIIRYSIDIALLNKQGILYREARTISCCMNYPRSQQAKGSEAIQKRGCFESKTSIPTVFIHKVYKNKDSLKEEDEWLYSLAGD